MVCVPAVKRAGIDRGVTSLCQRRSEDEKKGPLIECGPPRLCHLQQTNHSGMSWTESTKWVNARVMIVHRRVRGKTPSQHQKPLGVLLLLRSRQAIEKATEELGVLPCKIKMFLEVLLALPIYIFICYVLITYKHIIKAMTSLDNLLDEEGVEQLKKRENLKDVIEHGKAKFLPGKKGGWSSAEIDKKTDEEVEKLYNIYMQRQVQVKGEMTARAMGSHIVNLYSNGVSKVLKIDDIEKLKQDIEEDPI